MTVRFGRRRSCTCPFVNRIKSTLVRLGIRNFKPTLRKAFQRRTTRGQGLRMEGLSDPQTNEVIFG